ncbi:MAG TPA: nodulation protein NfeD [Anaeromyxobacteraceae bacterium]|nr:nodulation protein NfeD [Anaeromyxobacteraceae bacterium]
MQGSRRNGRIAVFALCALAGAAALGRAASAEPAPDVTPQQRRVLSVTVKGPITSGTAEYLESSITRAANERFDLLAITLDTPGGHLEATRDIVQRMLASEVPIAVWVGPAGARAGSAGVFITLAAHYAGMHPASNIGAAHPVLAGGQDVKQQAGEDMAKKIENDTAAFARSIAAERGRNADWAEKAVRESVSVTAEEARKLKVIDEVAPDLATLVADANGKTVKVAGRQTQIHTRNAVLEPQRMTIRQRTLSFIADPNVAALLLLVGMMGLALEMYHPGSIFPGALGALCLFLSFMAMRVIPVNAGAVVLLVAGVAMLIAEAWLPTHGLLGVGGAACLVIGTLLFIDRDAPDYQFDPEAFQMSPIVVWPTPIVLAGIVAFVGWKVVGSRRARLVAGAPGLVGESGEALGDVGPEGGMVFVHGEYWSARSAQPIPKGARVRVVAVDGLVTTVEREAQSHP